MSLCGFSTQELVAEVIKRLRGSKDVGAKWTSASGPETWPDWYIAKACLHNENAPQDLIDLKRFALCLRRISPEIERAINERNEK